MGKCIAAIDIGTTAVKVSLFDLSLRQLCSCAEEYALNILPGDRIEADAEVYLNAIRDGFAKVLRGGDHEPAALGITTQGETLTAVDENGRPLIPFIVWLDGRAGKAAEKLKQRITEETFYRETGLPAIDGALPLAKLAMIAEEQPELYARTSRFLLLEDYFLYLFTGRFVSEKSLQTSTGWFSLREDDICSGFLESAGIGREKLPDFLEPGEIAGTLLPEIAGMLGLPAGIPVAAGAMDQTAAALAAGCTGKGTVTETTGTALTAAACTERPRLDTEHRMTVYRHAVPGKYLYLAIGNTGGRSLTWLRDLIGVNGGYDRMNELAARVPPGSEGVLFLPFLEGLVDPDTCPDASGCFFGLRLGTTAAHLTRSVMEGVACQLKDFICLMEERGCPVTRVISLGGGARSRVWMQIKADICGVPFDLPETTEMASRGAALLAAWGAGLIPEGVIPGNTLTAGYGPDPENTGTYGKVYRDHRRLYDALLPIYEGRTFE